jgi:galactokinase/mevalonate kinase-like predicted kinase
VSAPGRANLIGNPSDQYGGCQVSCSVALRARVTLEESADTRLATAGHEAAVSSEADLAFRDDLLDLARAVLRFVGAPLPRARITYESEIPVRSGLAGSTALVVALLRGVLAWRGEELVNHRLAEAARKLEREDLGIVCGFGDQYMAVFGGLRFLDFQGKAHGDATETTRFAGVEDLGPSVPNLPFVLGFTGVQHASSAVHAPIRERWLAGERAVRDGYARVAALGAEGRRALLAEDWVRLGRAMNENHEIQRGLGGSGESNERLIAAALAAGASGAKLAGAGHGGTIVALWPDADISVLEHALRNAGAEAVYRPEPVAGVTIESISPADGIA